MTGGITDGEKDGLVGLFGGLKGFLTPWIPVHRIVCVLKEVRGFFLDQTIGVFLLVGHFGLLSCVSLKVCLFRRRAWGFSGLFCFLAAYPDGDHPYGTNQGGDSHGRSMG